eukprot:TRINITY_DN63350_c0_g1_i1.p1 TRINITY_DN63350_c0_g1~~TRINITY_DN63350_c0_g1_i1.p1  ORF type:complete len:346 (+),score=50.21 TRINITY_DN63350_c0_g1_i1:68-1105(+)
MAGLLETPAAALIRSLSFCSPVDWGRSRAVHKEFSMLLGDAVLFDTAGVTPASLTSTSALGDAARSGLVHIVAARLHFCEDPNAREKKHPKYTPLHRAASGGHRVVARLLLAKKANALTRDRLGFCALHFAANQSPGLVTDLLKAGCEINAANLQGITPLHSAAGMGRVDICDLLLESGATAGMQNAAGITPATFARKAAAKKIGPEAEACTALADRLEAAESALGAEEGSQDVWCFLEDADVEGASWQAFPESASETLTTARLCGESQLSLVINDRSYEVDLDDMTQKNAETGRVRPISLRKPSSVQLGSRSGYTRHWVPAAPGHWDGLVSNGISITASSLRPL